MLITHSELTAQLSTIQNTILVSQFSRKALLQPTIVYLTNVKKTELKRLQNPNIEKIKFEVKVKFQGLNLNFVFHVAKIEHKTTPAPFEVIHIDLERDPQLLDLTYGKIVFYNPYSGPKYTTSF